MADRDITHVNIQLGCTDGFRYLGVQPPLTEAQSELLQHHQSQGEPVPEHWTVRTPHKGPAHSEVGYSSHIGDERLVEVAEKIASILTDDDTVVHIDKRFRPIGFGHFLFDGQAERLG
jgi:hypothetical protein